jgi:hypothetical protein
VNVLSPIPLISGVHVHGRKYADPKRGIAVADLAGDIPPTRDVLITHFAEGKVMSEKGEYDLVKKGQAIANYYEKWFERAIFDDGFFHADLHGGNMFYKELPGSKPPFKITAIDFGSSGRLSPQQQRGAFKFALALMAESPEDAARALAELSSINKAGIDELTSAYREMFKRSLKRSELLPTAIAITIDKGLNLDRSLLQFQRGYDFVRSALNGVNAELDLVDPKGRLPRYSPTTIHAKVVARRLGGDLLSQAKRDLGRGFGLGRTHPAGLVDIDETHFIPSSYLRDFARRNFGRSVNRVVRHVCKGSVLQVLDRLPAPK